MSFFKYSVKILKISRLQHGQLNKLLHLLGNDYSIATSMITASYVETTGTKSDYLLSVIYILFCRGLKHVGRNYVDLVHSDG